MMPPKLKFVDSCLVELATACRPLRESDLTVGELTVWKDLRGDERKITWLRGRRALRKLRVRQGYGADTSGLSFPSPQYSVSHSGKLSLAAGVRDTVQGVGVDIELDRRPGTAFARFFMADDELKYIRGLRGHTASQRVLRIWTIKEALFKATPDNRSLVLRSFRLTDPNLKEGEAAVVSRPGLGLHYSSISLDDGQLSVAISRQSEHGDDR